MACSTALLAPPMTAWLLLLTLATVTMAVDPLQDFLNLLERREDRRHSSRCPRPPLLPFPGRER